MAMNRFYFEDGANNKRGGTGVAVMEEPRIP